MDEESNPGETRWSAMREVTIRLPNKEPYQIQFLVGIPERIPSGRWKCRVGVRNGPDLRTRLVHGQDSLQALNLAVDYLQVQVEQVSLEFGQHAEFLGQSNLWLGMTYESVLDTRP